MMFLPQIPCGKASLRAKIAQSVAYPADDSSTALLLAEKDFDHQRYVRGYCLNILVGRADTLVLMTRGTEA